MYLTRLLQASRSPAHSAGKDRSAEGLGEGLALSQPLPLHQNSSAGILQQKTGYKTKRPQSFDRGLLAKEGERRRKELLILYARPFQLTIRQRSCRILVQVLSWHYAEGMAML